VQLQSLIGRVDFLRRHGRVVWPYLTPRKVANLTLNEVEMRLARPNPRSVPPYIKLESTPLCHMSCAGCAHVSKDYKKTLNSTMRMSVDRIAEIVDPVARDLIGVSLSGYGEPLLNQALPDIVTYLRSRRICTTFPTNMSVRLSDAQVDALVSAAPDMMMISLDGASEETYRQYRVGGNFELVLENVRRLVDAKQRLGTARPFLVWKMVIFPHNAHEVPIAKRRAKALGFDACDFVIDNTGPEFAATLAEKNRKMVAARKPCFWAWNTAVIRWDGTVQACCWNKVPLGNAADQGLRDVWRSEPYRQLRRGFARRNYGQSMASDCRRCLGLEAPTEHVVAEPTLRRPPGEPVAIQGRAASDPRSAPVARIE
jgi:MoaA/NifB/PqqE/SkfB family radical SAM enzyme